MNFLMGNERWIQRAIRRFPDAVKRGIVEIGAGEGDLCGRLARQFPQAPLTSYDLAPRPPGLDSRVNWIQGDLFDTPAPPSGGVVIASLFLHHFEGPALTALGRWMENFKVGIFNEPDRAHLPHMLGGLMHPWINRVTRHDMHVSIRAGFASGEIQEGLRLDPRDWKFEETSTWRGARRVVIWKP